MKSVVVYDSKKGSTEDCALKIKEALNSDIFYLKNKKKIVLDNYDLVIIGTPMYMGHPMKTIVQFCKANVESLKQKRCAFFLCGLSPENEMIDALKRFLPSEMIDNDTVISHFGGELRVEKAHFLEKFMMKKMIEMSKTKFELKTLEIDHFIKSVKDVK